MQRLSRFGVGPRIMLPSLTYGVLAWIATRSWPDVCLVSGVPHSFFLTAGVLLLAIGVPMWLYSAVTVMRAYNRDELVTTGAFRICRHPIYAAAILFMLPGVALLTRSWPVMITPLVAYLIFKLLIRTEDEYLQQRFGKSYTEYRARVNELFPTLRRNRTG